MKFKAAIKCIWLTVLIALSTQTFASQDVSEISVIAHPSVQSSTLNLSQLRRIFSMRQVSWPNGSVTRVFVLQNKNEFHEVFCKSKLNMFPYQLERLWNKLIYSGLGEAPTKVKDLQEMILKVSSTPGAIGYLPSQLLNPPEAPSSDLGVIVIKEG